MPDAAFVPVDISLSVLGVHTDLFSGVLPFCCVVSWRIRVFRVRFQDPNLHTHRAPMRSYVSAFGTTEKDGFRQVARNKVAVRQLGAVVVADVRVELDHVLALQVAWTVVVACDIFAWNVSAALLVRLREILPLVAQRAGADRRMTASLVFGGSLKNVFAITGNAHGDANGVLEWAAVDGLKFAFPALFEHRTRDLTYEWAGSFRTSTQRCTLSNL